MENSASAPFFWNEKPSLEVTVVDDWNDAVRDMPLVWQGGRSMVKKGVSERH